MVQFNYVTLAMAIVVGRTIAMPTARPISRNNNGFGLETRAPNGTLELATTDYVIQRGGTEIDWSSMAHTFSETWTTGSSAIMTIDAGAYTYQTVASLFQIDQHNGACNQQDTLEAQFGGVTHYVHLKNSATGGRMGNKCESTAVLSQVQQGIDECVGSLTALTQDGKHPSQGCCQFSHKGGTWRGFMLFSNDLDQDWDAIPCAPVDP